LLTILGKQPLALREMKLLKRLSCELVLVLSKEGEEAIHFGEGFGDGLEVFLGQGIKLVVRAFDTEASKVSERILDFCIVIVLLFEHFAQIQL